MPSSTTSSEFVFPNDQPVVVLDSKEAFSALTKQEQLYAHYLSRASFYGGLIVLLQTSPESPKIFRLIHRLNTAEGTDLLKEKAIKAGVSEEDFKAYTAYCSGFYSNMGNYKGFGDSKFVPNITVETFETIVKSSAAYQADQVAVEQLWANCKGPMFSLSPREKQLGLGEKGVTTYFSSNCNEEDSDKINRFFKAKDIEGYNNRAFKTVGADGKVAYEIRNAGVAAGTLLKEQFEEATFEVTTGDFSSLLKLVNDNLELAKQHASNNVEKDMLSCYIKSFQEGSLDAHKDGSRHWIKNKGPAVETYIGFIENYRDPVGMRAEFEGFVTMVNRGQSAKFQELVNHAEELLSRLPWPKEFEKDTFLLPDFTSLDVLSFAGSMVPAGINIPNYDEIRQSEGFKNVYLNNVISASYKADDKKTTFVNMEDHELLKKFTLPSFEVQVGLHELLGHGSGKLLRREKDGSLNYSPDLLNPLTGKPLDKHYEVGETYDSLFTSLGSAYEECRAEAVGLFLCCYDDVLRIFGVTESMSDVIYINWLSMCLAALKGVEMYSPGANEWKQAHSRARFVILHVLLEAGQGFVSVKEVKGDDGNPDLLLTMDKSKLESVGKEAIGKFLLKLQVFKSIGDLQGAKEMFDHYSEVKGDGPFPFGKWRDIIVARKKPRKILVQANTFVKDEQLSFVDYEPNTHGFIKSWSERFTDKEFKTLDVLLEDLNEKDKLHFH